MITCTEPEEDQHYPQSQEDETILFEETFDYPATPSELSIDEQQDLSGTVTIRLRNSHVIFPLWAMCILYFFR